MKVCPGEKAFFDSKKICSSSCVEFEMQKFFPSDGSNQCLPKCPKSIYALEGSELHCKDSCNKYSGIDPRYDQQQQRCVSDCTLIDANLFSVDGKCSLKCPNNMKYYD